MNLRDSARKPATSDRRSDPPSCTEQREANELLDGAEEAQGSTMNAVTASHIISEFSVLGSMYTCPTLTPMEQVVFDEFAEIDKAGDMSWFLNVHPASTIGYLPDDEDDADCVVCKYVDPAHHLEHLSRQQSIATEHERAAQDKSSQQPPLPQRPNKRPLGGLASSKYNPDRNVRIKLKHQACKALEDARTKHDKSTGETQHQAKGCDGADDPEDAELASPIIDDEVDCTVEDLHIMQYAERAGKMVSYSERLLVKKQKPQSVVNTLTLAMRTKGKRCATVLIEEDHHSLAFRARRESETIALINALDRRVSDDYYLRQRCAVKSTCAQCQEERLALPLTYEQELPCQHRAYRQTANRSVYKIQHMQKPVPEPEIASQQAAKGLTKATKKVKAMAQTWCYCGESDKTRVMYRCSNDNCFIGWFHDQCLRALRNDKKMPWRKGAWYCDSCDLETRHGKEKVDPLALSFSKEDILETFGMGFGRSDAADLINDVYGLGYRQA